MAIAVAQSLLNADFTGASHGSLSQAITVQPGSTVAVFAGWSNPGTTITASVTDSNSATYLDGTQVNATVESFSIGRWYLNNVSGTFTVTVTFSSATDFVYLYVVEVGSTIGLADGSAGQYQNPAPTGTDGVTVGSISNAVQPALLLGLIQSTSTGAIAASPGTGFTSNNADATTKTLIESKRVTATGPQSITATDANGDNVVAVGFIFDEHLVPTITVQPVSQEVRAGAASPTFSVTATSSGGSLSYLWFKNGVSTGATVNPYTPPVLLLSDNGAYYRCDVTDSNGTTSSANANVTITTPLIRPPLFASMPLVAASGNPALTGVAGTGSVGTLAPATTGSLTGNAATGSPGSVAPSSSVPLSGVAASGSPGSVTPGTTIALTGVAATGSAGSVGAALSAPITGNAATGSAGTVAASSQPALTGVAATGAVGSVGLLPLTVALSGVAGTGSPGSVAASTVAPVSGVAATGSAGSVSPSSALPLTGVAGTGSPGTVAAALTAPISGNQATGAVGSVSIGGVVVALTGVAATGAVGTLVAASSVPLTGTGAAGGVGSVGPALGVPLTGVAATAAVGSVSPALSAPLAGVGATGGVGALAPRLAAALTGVTAIGTAGSLGVSTPVTVALTGVEGIGQVGSMGAPPPPPPAPPAAPAGPALFSTDRRNTVRSYNLARQLRMPKGARRRPRGA